MKELSPLAQKYKDAFDGRLIVFDIDGTLLDTEYAILHSLQDTLNLVTDRTYSIDELKLSLIIGSKKSLNLCQKI